jgi:hypothetical protein
VEVIPSDLISSFSHWLECIFIALPQRLILKFVNYFFGLLMNDNWLIANYLAFGFDGFWKDVTVFFVGIHIRFSRR